MKTEMILMQMLMVVAIYFICYQNRLPKEQRPKNILARDRIVDVIMIVSALMYGSAMIQYLLK